MCCKNHTEHMNIVCT